MVRPHVEFIQSQVLPWQSGVPGGACADAECRVLSQDPDNGESSLVLRYPRGWKREGLWHTTVDEEIFVLDGELTVNGVAYGKYSYGFLPAGFPRNGMEAANGAVVLTFLSGTLSDAAGEGDAGGVADRLVEKIDVRQTGLRNDFDLKRTPWKTTGGMGLTNLRIDPETAERTWVIGVLPMNPILKVETHPVVEEMYMLEGAIVGNLGVMRPGAYFWRPPEVRHGPYGSRTGCLILLRSRGGPLSTKFHEDGVFSWKPDHRPVLPPELEAVGRAPWMPAADF